MFRSVGLSLILVAVFALVACAQAPSLATTPTRSPAASPTSAATPAPLSSPAASPTTSTRAPAGSPTASPPPATTPGAVPPEASTAVEEATAAVAQQLGVPASQVTVVSVQMVEWSDTSLGCPEPEMAYAEVITPGYLIRLSAGGQTFEYHADREDTVVTCQNPQPPAIVAQ